MQIHYLEIGTREVDAVCTAYAAANGVQFGEPEAGLGNARTAALPGGGLLGVRAPLHESEEPVVRPYWLSDDIESALAGAVEAGRVVAHPPMLIPGHGTFAIYTQGGIHHGLWPLQAHEGPGSREVRGPSQSQALTVVQRHWTDGGLGREMPFGNGRRPWRTRNGNGE